METTGIAPPISNQMVLRDVGTRFASGRQLTYIEENMAMTAVAVVTNRNYGPGPAEMTLSRPELPENIKGVLAQYAI